MDIKTDWTPDDYYNIHDDLTRTEGNIHEIAAVLSAAGRPATLDEKLNWTMQDFPTDEEMNRIVRNINALRTAMNTPELPEPQPFYSEEYVTADRINDLESCIQRAYWTSVHTACPGKWWEAAGRFRGGRDPLRGYRFQGGVSKCLHGPANRCIYRADEGVERWTVIT